MYSLCSLNVFLSFLICLFFFILCLRSIVWFGMNFQLFSQYHPSLRVYNSNDNWTIHWFYASVFSQLFNGLILPFVTLRREKKRIIETKTNVNKQKIIFILMWPMKIEHFQLVNQMNQYESFKWNLMFFFFQWYSANV